MASYGKATCKFAMIIAIQNIGGQGRDSLFLVLRSTIVPMHNQKLCMRTMKREDAYKVKKTLQPCVSWGTNTVETQYKEIDI